MGKCMGKETESFGFEEFLLPGSETFDILC